MQILDNNSTSYLHPDLELDSTVCLIFAELTSSVPCGRCPGVFKTVYKGCGGRLEPERFSVASITGNGSELVEFWRCSKRLECDFKDYVPKRLLSPQVTLEAVDTKVFKVHCTILLTPPF